MTVAYRVLLREVLFHKRQSKAPKCVIYGSGEAGIQFLTASMQGNAYNVICLIDDNPLQIGRIFYGRQVYHKDKLKEILNLYGINLIVLAIPSVSKKNRKKILDFLLNFSIRVVSVPNLHDLQTGNFKITQTQDISVEDLLGREVVVPDKKLIRNHVNHKIVLVTGAGGSIGSEISRQLINYKIKKLILLDNNEPSLFAIQQELLRDSSIDVLALLGSVTDNNLIGKLFNNYNIDIVFHAAAYKHVPIVEENPYVAFYNNVIGTKIILDHAVSTKCSSFTLISSDKAVRPTNLMGASKRIAELLCQASSDTKSITVSMVRFGNVLGSSGSVIPTFFDQINRGGPITVTHPDVIRFFMTIPEAAQLVLQSAGMSSGGEVFLLEMGEPVNIYDLAKRLIRLSGHNLKNENSGEGIEVVFTGLRPGEKLYEELLVDSSAMKTNHPRIFKASEQMLSNDDLNDLIDKCLKLLRSDNLSEFKKILSYSIVKYNENSHKSYPPKFSNEDRENTKCPPSVTTKLKPSKNQSHFLFGSKILTNFLHLYFRIKRGITLGARCIIVDNSSQILLVKHSYTDGWYIPGGGVETNEACEDALRREISEECGIVINSFKILETKFNTRVSARDHVVVYFSDDWYSDNNSSDGEIIDSRFFAYDNLPQDIEPLSSECIVNWHLKTYN